MFDNFDPNDPKTMGLLMAAAGLLGGAPGQRKNFGADLGHALQQGLLGYSGAQSMKARLGEEEQQRQMREMQLQQMKAAQQREEAMRGLAQRSFAPNQNLVQNDDEGYAMPSSGGGGMPAFAQGMMGIDPMMAISMMPKPKGPMALSEGARLVDPESGREIASNPKPMGPKEGDTREIKSGRNIITYEFSGGKWNKIGMSAMDKPEGPEKVKPQLIDGPNGPMWVTPPTAGAQSGAMPVIGPDGKPLASKQSAKEQKDREKDEVRERGALERADMVLGKVGEAIKQSGVTTTGPIGAITRNIPGTGAYNLNRTLDTIKANIGFGELQAMREASPTGGALGQVAVQELNMLQAVLGSLDTAQSQDQLEKSLYAVEKHYNNWKRAVQKAKAGDKDQPGSGWSIKPLN